ncbi:MAG: site-specific integrase [Gammaproteobacteria bacterium]|nr:site-specific integrase [Gammaproteobacteria bacterium]
MAYIQQRVTIDGRTRYRALVRLKGHPAQTATFERKTDARRWAQQTEAAIREGRHFKSSEAKRHTLAELVDRYVRNVLPNKPKSLRIQTQQLAWWKEQIGNYTLADVTPALVAECRDRLARGITPQKQQRSPATVNRYMAVLSHAFTIAVKEWGWLDDSPMRRVTKPRESTARVRFLTDDERIRLLQACEDSKNPHLYTVVVLALSTGARKSEIINLGWKDVDLNRGIIVLHETKNRERRALPLTGRALALIKELSKVRRLDTDLLFPGHDPRQPMDLRAPWEAALKKAGIEDFRFHDLRHSAASYLAMSGASLMEIAAVLGHKTLQMVKRYAHLSEQHTAGVVARMNEKIFGER